MGQNSRSLFNDLSEIKPPEETSNFALRERTGTVDLDLLELENNDRIRLDLFPDLSFTVTLKKRPAFHAVGDVDVYWANSGDPTWAHLEDYHDVILTVNRTTQKAILYAITNQGTFAVIPTASKHRYLVYEAVPLDCATDLPSGSDRSLIRSATNRTVMNTGCEEQNADGDFVIDMFFSYSHEAEAFTGDVVAHAVSQAETVNVGLANSEIFNTVLRVVDIGVADNFVGIYSPALNPNLDVYREQMEAAGADMLADYQTPNPDVENAGGWAFVPGRTSINSISGPTVFRHEWGHNSGSNHCTPGVLPYSSGYDNGTQSSRTHLCGNSSNFFSNPRIDDVNGIPIGDAATADNARAIMEVRGEVMANYRTHLVPYDETDFGICPAAIAEGAYYIQNVASDNYLTPANVGNQGEKLFQGATNVDNEDIWEVHDFGNGTQMIYNRNRNTSIDVFGGSSAAGANVGVWGDDLDNLNQQWNIQRATSGNYIITSRRSGLSLRIPNGMMASGDEVWQATYDETDLAEWRFIPVSVSPAAVSLSLEINNASCSDGTSDGSVEIIAAGSDGAFTYNWEDGSTQEMRSNLSSGNYSVTVTSAGRSYFKVGSVRGAAPLFAEVALTRATQTEGGSVTITNVLNASGSLSYNWSDGGPAIPNRTNMQEGDYAVTITDAKGCQEVRQVRVTKTITAGDYVVQHVPSGLYMRKEGGQVLLGNCPTDDELYRWTVIDEGGRVVKMRSTNGGGIFTVFGRAESGAEYWTGGDGNVSPHKHTLTSTGTDTWKMRNQFQGFYTGTNGDAIDAAVIHEDVSIADADEWRFLPIVACSPAIGSICDDGQSSSENDMINLLCNCCGQGLDISLPVDLIDFRGEALAKANQLTWRTATETRNAGFFLQRSLNGRAFTDINWIAGRGFSTDNTDYVYLDQEPFFGTSFYRLRQLDLDGAETISAVISLDRADGTSWSFFPNPVVPGAALRVLVRGETANFSLFSLNGQLVRSFRQEAAGGPVALVTTGLLPGVYLLRNNHDGSAQRVVLQ